MTDLLNAAGLIPDGVRSIYAVHHERLKRCQSGDRLPVLLDAVSDLHLREEGGNALAANLLTSWVHMCDDTWRHRDDLIEALSNVRQPRDAAIVEPSSREWFDALPNVIQVFRGCSADGWHGLSWTTDKSVALGFAHGHRGIRVPEPVIATARIPKRMVLFATNEREEAEVLLDWDELRNVRIKPARMLVAMLAIEKAKKAA